MCDVPTNLITVHTTIFIIMIKKMAKKSSMHLSQEKGRIQSSRYRESPCLVFNRQRHKAEADMLDNDISPEQRKCLETAFEAADKNGDGILSADEYYEIFQTHGLSIGKKNEKHNYE